MFPVEAGAPEISATQALNSYIYPVRAFTTFLCRLQFWLLSDLIRGRLLSKGIFVVIKSKKSEDSPEIKVYKLEIEKLELKEKVKKEKAEKTTLALSLTMVLLSLIHI